MVNARFIMLKDSFCYAAPWAHARLFLLAATWACAWLVLAPAAQAAETPPAADPARPALATPFDQYQAWRDEPLGDWREVNRRVDEVGGWRTYLRESQENGTGMGHENHGNHAH